MRKSAIIYSILVLVFSAFSALADGGDQLSLRDMYTESTVIVVGHTGAAGNWIPGKREAGSEYQIFTRSFPIVVEKTIKGAAPAKLAVDETAYKYFGNASAKTSDEIGIDSNLAKNTGRRLFFLVREETGRYTEVESDRIFAPKDKDLDVYVKRLDELAEMYLKGEPSKERTAEFLVSLTENPVTRFDGAYELAGSFAALDGKNEHGEHLHSLMAAMAEVSAHPQPYTEAELKAGAEHDSFDNGFDGDFARVLTAQQKQRLVKAFFSVEFDYQPQHAEGSTDAYYEPLGEADSYLAETCSHLGDRRVTLRVMNELPTLVRYDNYTAAKLLDIIAEHSGNEKLRALVEKYDGVAYGSDWDKIDDKSICYDFADSVTAEQKAAQLAKLPAKTYSQRRAELLDKIFAAMNELMAKNVGGW